MRWVLTGGFFLSLLCLVSQPGLAQEGGDENAHAMLQVGHGLFCNTEQQVQRYVSIFDGDSEKAIGQVNAEAHDDNACAVASVAFIPGAATPTTLRNGKSSYRVVEIVVVGVVTPVGLQQVQPIVQFAMAPVEGIDI